MGLSLQVIQTLKELQGSIITFMPINTALKNIQIPGKTNYQNEFKKKLKIWKALYLLGKLKF